MHSCEVVYSPLALQDLDDIWDYIAVEQDNPTAAERIVEGILARIDLLSSFPESGTPLSSIYPCAPITGSWSVTTISRFTVFTRRSNQKVYIDRVLHRKRDYLQVLLAE